VSVLASVCGRASVLACGRSIARVQVIDRAFEIVRASVRASVWSVRACV
jgi:hypothetical protein